MLLLGVLASGPAHGYALASELHRLSNGLLVVVEGSLYPALHRLEASGLVSSSWDNETGRRRRLYALTAKGKKALKEETQAWVEFRDCVDEVLGGLA